MSAHDALLAHFQTLQGEPLGFSDWMTISQDRIQQFADATGDRQWIHVDVARCERESPFGAPIAHGFLTLSLLAPSVMAVVLDGLAVRQVVNYGLDKVRFMAPVRAGRRVRNHIRLLAVEARGADRLQLTTENTLEIEGEAKPALVAQSITLLFAGD